MGGTLELVRDDRSVNLRRAPLRYLDGMEELKTLEIWRGTRPLSADRLPEQVDTQHSDVLTLFPKSSLSER